MITRTGKLLALVPVVASFLLSDKTLASFGVMLGGGMILWIPYWLAWWLSDGFIAYYQSTGDDGFDYHQRNGETWGGNGDAFEASRSHQALLAQSHHDRYSQQNIGSGYRTGAQGFGFYNGSVRQD